MMAITTSSTTLCTSNGPMIPTWTPILEAEIVIPPFTDTRRPMVYLLDAHHNYEPPEILGLFGSQKSAIDAWDMSQQKAKGHNGRITILNVV